MVVAIDIYSEDIESINEDIVKFNNNKSTETINLNLRTVVFLQNILKKTFQTSERVRNEAELISDSLVESGVILP